MSAQAEMRNIDNTDVSDSASRCRYESWSKLGQGRMFRKAPTIVFLQHYVYDIVLWLSLCEGLQSFLKTTVVILEARQILGKCCVAIASGFAIDFINSWIQK